MYGTFPLSSFDYLLLHSLFGERGLPMPCARAGSRMFSPPETSAVARPGTPHAHPLPTFTDRSRFPVPREKYLIQRRSAAQSEPIVQFGPLMCLVLARSSLLFPAPPLPHVAPPPLSLHMLSYIHTSLCASATGPAHHTPSHCAIEGTLIACGWPALHASAHHSAPSHCASAQHGGSLGGSRGGSQGSSHA